MTFSLAELARILDLRIIGTREDALAVFARFQSVPDSLPRGLATMEAQADGSRLNAVLLRTPYGDGWVCYRRADMRHVKRPGRLPVIPLLELRDFLREVRAS